MGECMVTRRGALALGGGVVAALAGASVSAPQNAARGRVSAEAINWTAVGHALGKKGQMMPGGVYRVGMPRTDLSVTVKGVPVKAGFALGSYAAFQQMGDATMVMGDLVLLDHEVNPVMSGLFAQSLSLRALHNHLNEMSPHVLYLHYEGLGEAVALARALRVALSASATPLGGAPATAAPATTTLDLTALQKALGQPGKVMPGGIIQVSVPRIETIKENSMILPPAMGVAISLNFQPLGAGQAAITGDFVLIGNEVTLVAQTLRDNGIEVTALHNHALTDTPRLFYMHFWATGNPLTLARGLRAALDQTNSRSAARL